MNEDFSDIINKFSNILKEKDIDLNNIVGGNPPPTDFNENNSQKDSINDFNLDINTIMKIKEVFDAINKNTHSPRNTLLSALRPYLEKSKKEKLEQYMKIANLLSVLFFNMSKEKCYKKHFHTDIF